MDKSRGIFTSPIKSLKEVKHLDVWSGKHTINDKQAFIHRKKQIRRKETGHHQEFVKHRRIFRRRRRRNHRKRNRKINLYRKNRRSKYRRRFHSSQRYRKRYKKYSRKVNRRRKYRTRHYSRRRHRRFRGKSHKLWIKKRTWHRRKVYAFQNIKTYKNSRLRRKYYKKGINKIFWKRRSKFRFRNYNGRRNRKISSKIYHKVWIRHSFRYHRRKYTFRKISHRRRKQFKNVHRHYKRNWHKQSRQRRIEATPIYKARQRLSHSATTRHVSGWLRGFGKRGIISIRRRIDKRWENELKQQRKTQRIAKHIDWIKRFQRRYTKLRHRKHSIQQRRRYYENPHRYSPNHSPHCRAQSVSLNEKAYTGLQHSGKTSTRYSHRTWYIQGKKRVYNPNIIHYQKSQLLRKKMYKEHGDGIGKQHKSGRFKDTMLPTHDHHSLATTPGVKYDSGLSDSVPDEKHPWVF